MFKTEFVVAGNLTLYVRREGVAAIPPLIFINSLGTDQRIWDDVTNRLASEYAIVRYDKRGHGLSDCPPPPYSIRDHVTDLAALLVALKIPQAVIIGISVGGMIALDFAATYPQQVAALVLCDTYFKIGTAEMWNERIHTLREQGMAALSAAILARWFAPNFEVQQPAAYRGYGNMLERMPLAGYTGTCEAIRDADLSKAVPQIKARTLVLCGELDVSTPPSLMQELAKLLPHARYVEIAGAGHLPCIENPAAVTTALQAFLEEQP